MGLNDTPRANRLHIGIYGKRNAGKSSLINALTDQDIALVSDTAGTTTDPVFKSMELHPVGPVVFIDTAGFDDEGELGKLRVERTHEVMDKTDVAVVVIDGAQMLEAAEEDFAKSCGLSFAAGELPESGTAGARAGDDRLPGKESKDKYEPVVPETYGVNTGVQVNQTANENISKLLELEKSWIDDLTSRNIPVIIAINKLERAKLNELQSEPQKSILRSGEREEVDNKTETEKNTVIAEHESTKCIQALKQATDNETYSNVGDANFETANFDAHTNSDPAKAITSDCITMLTTIISKNFGNCPVIPVSALTGTGLDELRNAIQKSLPEDYLREKILGDIVGDGELVMLVMPQDIQAPKGRLILPQVQTLRELLDRKCTTVATTADGFEKALAVLNKAPDLIITDSQCFDKVYKAKPVQNALTSFSVLFAAYKGDVDKFMAGASQLDDMTEKSKVLIAEACTHVPLSEDIGRVKIPNLLRKKFGNEIEIVNVCGNDFPASEMLQEFDLIIHCGACMFNRKHVLSRIAAAEAADVPITNYGIIMAKLAGILDKITLPE